MGARSRIVAAIDILRAGAFDVFDATHSRRIIGDCRDRQDFGLDKLISRQHQNGLEVVGRAAHETFDRDRHGAVSGNGACHRDGFGQRVCGRSVKDLKRGRLALFKDEIQDAGHNLHRRAAVHSLAPRHATGEGLCIIVGEKRRFVLRRIARGDPVGGKLFCQEAALVKNAIVVFSPLVVAEDNGTGQAEVIEPAIIVLGFLQFAIDIDLGIATRHKSQNDVVPRVRGDWFFDLKVLFIGSREPSIALLEFERCKIFLAEEGMLVAYFVWISPCLKRNCGSEGRVAHVGGLDLCCVGSAGRKFRAFAKFGGDDRDGGVGRAVKVVRRRVFCVGLVHVPNAVIVREWIVGADGLAARLTAPAHHEIGSVLHQGQCHPDERLAVRIPRVDLERQAVPDHVDETQIAPRRLVDQLRILEARDR